MGSVEIFQGQDGLWYWHVKARNHRIVAQSEGYSDRRGARRGVEALMRAVGAQWDAEDVLGA